MLRMLVFLFAACALSNAAATELAIAPKIDPQDSWTYVNTTEDKAGWHQTREDITVIRASSTGIVLSAKPTGSTMPATEHILGLDWSRIRSVNGKETIVNQPMKFPLTSGGHWVVDYTEDNPNRDHKSEHMHYDYKVVGWEEVTVPAGTFRAIKIEADREWVAEIAPSLTSGAVAHVDAAGSIAAAATNRTTERTTSGQLYKAIWYAPEVKRFVKSIEEVYSSISVRSQRTTVELEAFRPAG
jgi:hypothetical protein